MLVLGVPWDWVQTCFVTRKKQHLLRDAVTGALAGGAVGGGYGLATMPTTSPKAVSPGDQNPWLDRISEWVSEKVPGPDAARPKQKTDQQQQPTTPGGKLEHLKKLEDAAKPSWAHEIGATAKSNPVTTSVIGGAATDLGVGTALAHQGKNIAPSAFSDLSQALKGQLATTKELGNTPIAQAIRSLFVEGKGGDIQAKQITQDLLSGNPEKLKLLSRHPNARSIMQAVRGQMPVRPMTFSQSLLQGAPKSRFSPKKLPIPKALMRTPGGLKGKLIGGGLLAGAGWLGKGWLESERGQSALAKAMENLGGK